MFEVYEKRIEQEVKTLNQRQLVALSLICCMRLSPLYSEFSKIEGWGDESILNQCRQAAHSWLGGKEVRISKLMNPLEAVIPDTEDFNSIWVSLALNAAVSHVHLLEQIQTRECSPLISILQYCYDTVDFYVQELLDPDCKGGVVESDIDNHPAMVEEIEWQFCLISQIRDCQDVVAFLNVKNIEPIITFA